jgi:hypothetical protein
MIPWWWALIAFVFGIIVGIALIAVVSANEE